MKVIDISIPWGYHGNMKTKTFYLATRQIEKLESLVKKTGLSMAEHVRRAIDNYLKLVEREKK